MGFTSTNLVDHVLKLGFGRILAEGPHYGAQLLRGDRAVAVLVEERERFLELGDLLLGQLVSHLFNVSLGRDRASTSLNLRLKTGPGFHFRYSLFTRKKKLGGEN